MEPASLSSPIASAPYETIPTSSGRTVAYAIYGAPAKPDPASTTTTIKTIFYAHGFPGSRLEAGFFSGELLQRHNARCIALDRPGMGHSSHDPNRHILDWPSDVLDVADHLGIDTFYILGVSGGGPYALACAKEIPRVDSTTTTVTADEQPQSPRGRLRGVAVCSAIYPVSLGTEGMMTGARILLSSGAWLPRSMTGWLLDWEMGGPARNPDPTVLKNHVDRAMARRQAVENTVYRRHGVREVVIEGMREAFRQGSEGVATDLMLVSGDWGFGVGDIPDQGKGLSIWHGRLDVNCPVQMAEKARELMPKAQAHFFDEEAHLSTSVNHVEDIIADLLRD